MSTTGSERARESGTQLTISCSGQCADPRRQRTFAGQNLHLTKLLRRSGCPPGTSGCACPARSSVLDSLTIIRQINPVTYQLQLPSQYNSHSSFHVSLLKPYHSPVSVSTEPGPTEEPPLPLMQEDGAIYTVNEILDSRRRSGLLEYLVDWEGYGPEERSWVTRIDILDPTLLETFHSTLRGTTTMSGSGAGPWRRGYCHRSAWLFHHPITTIT